MMADVYKYYQYSPSLEVMSQCDYSETIRKTASYSGSEASSTNHFTETPYVYDVAPVNSIPGHMPGISELAPTKTVRMEHETAPG